MAAYLDDYFGGKAVPVPTKTPTQNTATTTPAPVKVPGKVTAPKVVPGNPTNGMFVGPIPTGTTRTATGYETPAPKVYAKTKIWDRNGNQVEVWSEGPNAGYAVDGGYLVIQGEAPVTPGGGTGGNPPGGGGGNGNTDMPANTNIDVLKAILRGKGMPASVVDASSAFLTKILIDLGGDYDNAAEVWLNSKEFTLKDGTKLASPFYAEYGYLNEGLNNPKTPAELYNFVKGAKDIITKYGMSDKFLTPDSLKEYVKNGVTAEDLDARGNLYRLKSIQTDKAYIDSLKAGGYISSETQLQDFFADPKIGKAQFEQNAAVAGIGAEAIRRASAGLTYNKARFEKLAADMQAQGYSPEQIQTVASKNFETVSEQLQPTEMLAGVYDRTKQDTNDIQAQLEAEAFGGPASQLRKRVKAQEEAAFQAQSGLSGFALSTGGGLGQMF